MDIKKLNWLLILSVSLISIIIGGYIGFKMTSKFYLEASYSDVTSDMVFELSVLKELRDNELQNAIYLLESRLDTNILMFDSVDDISKARAERIRNILTLVSEYRTQYNVMNDDPEVEKLIQDIINKHI